MSQLRFDKYGGGYSIVCPVVLPTLGCIRYSPKRQRFVFISLVDHWEWTAEELKAIEEALRRAADKPAGEAPDA